MSNVGQRKKILYVVTQGNWGGAQKYVFDLATRCARQYDVYVASGTEDHQLPDALSAYPVSYVPLPHLVRATHPLYDLLALYDLYRLIRRLRPDIAHLNSSKAGVIGSLAAKLAGRTKVIFTMHGLVLTEPLSPLKKLLYFFFEKLSSYCKDVIIAVSAADKRAGRAYKLKAAEKIFVIHNGIDLSKLNFKKPVEARQALGRRASASFEGKQLIGTIADFYPTKGLAYLIEAARLFYEDSPNAIFILIGRGSPQYLDVLVRQYQLQNKFFIFSTLPQAASYLKAFDLFVLPSVKEGLPYTVLEAAAAGVPIVATTVGGIPEMLHNEHSAMLVPPADPGALAVAIDDLLKNQQKARNFSRQARARLKHFSLKRMVNQTEKIYESLL